MARPSVDLSLYLVTDSAMCVQRGLEAVVAEAVEGGVTLVQLREKHAATREFIDLAARLKAVLDGKGVPLLINDRVDVALAVGAAGVHVGQSDMRVRDVRRLLGRDAIVGLTMDTDEQVREAETLDVDYLGLGPIFPTATKEDHSEVLGYDGFIRRRNLSRHPCVAIGSVTEACAADLMRAGADGVAVVSAICRAEDPREAARRLRRAVEEAR
ncbi:thiamine phosphate synthase [Salidesulfovibrio onnuriiensis]|uniref:thiamine phosphate synthase n=1 Tax=Salidesulfovibrio onnuriiensis TaxID=2583823 RepID=UPI0011CA311A|nr:thiamine phosphate synthase [Salidesulfovibrio onnuriiensis]